MYFQGILFQGDKYRRSDLDYLEVTLNVIVVGVGPPRCPVDSMLYALIIFLDYSYNHVFSSFAL